MIVSDVVQKKVLVQKYGGTSVGSVERIEVVADSIKQRVDEGYGVVVVVSAMGSQTDVLVEMANQLTDQKPSDREYDALVSTGENVSASLLSMRLIHIGVDAVSLTGLQAGIQTEATHRRAKIKAIKPQRILNELQNNKVVVVTGFQGFTEEADITTIGRGGSDTSAVVLAAALGVEMCEIYTDVTGIFTTDPRIEAKAKKIDQISYDEMLELASLGANVLHPRAVEVGKQKGVKIMVASSFETTVMGTIVEERETMEIERPVTGIALKKGEARLSVAGVKDEPGIAAKIFSALAEEGVNVDMIIQSTAEKGINDISFTVNEDDLVLSKQILETLCKEMQIAEIKTQDNISKISIVGIGMISRQGVAAKMFDTLAEAGINIHMISTSEIKVSCAIDAEHGNKAVQILHQAFEMDS